MKNKTRLFQIFLILAIFAVITTYFVSASNDTYSFKPTGSFVSTQDDVDSLDITGFNDNNVLSIKYELYKGNEKHYGNANINIDILDKNGNKLNMDENYPYITYDRSGYFNTDVTIYFDIVKYLNYCKNAGNISILNEFKVSFYSYVTNESADLGSGEFDENDLIKNVIEERTIKLVNNGQLINSDIDFDNAHIGEFYLTPFNKEGVTVSSEIKYTDINLDTNTYSASLDISMGAMEDIKNYVYDIEMISEEFPYSNIIANSSQGFSIEAITNSNSMDIYYGNQVTNPLNKEESITLGNRKFLILKALRLDSQDSSFSETCQYKLTFNAINPDEKVTLILTINLNFEEPYIKGEGNNELICYSNAAYYRYIALDSTLGAYFNLNFTPYKTILEDKQGNVIYSDNLDFVKYLQTEENASVCNIKLPKNISEGFYTLKTYVYKGDIETDGQGVPIAPNDEDLTVAVSHTFYVEKVNKKLGYISEGINYSLDNNTLDLNVFTNDVTGYTVVNFYGLFNNDLLNTVENEIKIRIVSDLEKLEYLDDEHISTFENKLYVNGQTDIDSFYILVYPYNNESYIPVQVNINHISYKDYVLSFDNQNTVVKIPTTNPEGDSLNLSLKILVDGKVANINDYEYTYEVLNFDETKNNTSNIYFDKTEYGDVLYYNDFSVGSYIIRCSLVDFPDVYGDFELVIEKETISEEETYEYKIEIVNEKTEIEVPNKEGYENRLKVKTKVYRNEELTKIVPELKIVGDTYVSIRKGYIIVDDKATVGNTVILTASIEDGEGNIISDSKNFTLIKEIENNSESTVVPDDDTSGPGVNEDDKDNNTGEDSDTNDEFIVPSRIEVSGFLVNNNENYYKLSKATGDKIVLSYICYDENDKVISNPSLSVDLVWDDATGTNILKDYANKEIEIRANGIYTDRLVTVNFYGDGKIIHSLDLNIYKASNYTANMSFVQSSFVRGGKMEVKASFGNNTLIDFNVLLAIICYDKNDKIVSQSTNSVIIKAGKEYGYKDDEKFSAKVELPYDLEGIKVKAFLLEGTSLEDAKDYYYGTIALTNREVIVYE